MKKFYLWYQQQKGFKRFALRFILHWIYWGFVYLLIYFVITTDTARSMKEYLLTVTIMALVWTLLDIPMKKWIKRREGGRESK